MSTPQEPMTALAEAAASAHELYVSLIKSGFSEREALYLVGKILAANVSGGDQK